MSVSVNIKWHGEAFKKKMEASMIEKLTRVGIHVVNKIKQNISIPTWGDSTGGGSRKEKGAKGGTNYQGFARASKSGKKKKPKGSSTSRSSSKLSQGSNKKSSPSRRGGGGGGAGSNSSAKKKKKKR